MSGTPPPMPQHVASIYKELLDGLRSMKQQQWTITNYAVLLLAAVFAVAKAGLNVPHLSSRLNLLIALTAVIGTGLLIRIQYNMARSRARLDKMDATYFSYQELESTGLTRVGKYETRPAAAASDTISGDGSSRSFCSVFCGAAGSSFTGLCNTFYRGK